jgi:hypothetical protein
MDATTLARRLKTLRRTVLMLQTELRQSHLDEDLIAEIERQMEHGIATDPRCAGLGAAVDALRENMLSPRAELFPDTIRACEKLKDAIESVAGTLE